MFVCLFVLNKCVEGGVCFSLGDTVSLSESVSVELMFLAPAAFNIDFPGLEVFAFARVDDFCVHRDETGNRHAASRCFLLFQIYKQHLCKCHKLPWGIGAVLNLNTRSSSFCFFVLQIGSASKRGAGGAESLSFQGSAWLSSGVQQNQFLCIHAILLLLLQLLFLSEHATPWLDCVRYKKEPRRRLMCHFIGDWLKGPPTTPRMRVTSVMQLPEIGSH